VQYLLALHRSSFIIVLALAAAGEGIALLATHWSLAGFANWVLAAQAAAALGTIALCLRRRARRVASVAT
ncbi:MAG TPA: hypothetical protein VHE14_06040, partial [Solirubrobacteraceae bacterium]|nr:hypothetical protein [Solirubrobacteraceae bacterium]